ncbi:MAG: VOC family protein [Bacteroidales bacterium]
MTNVIFIIYVANQQKSKDFYENVLQQKPLLDVPGMTEFIINKQTKMGIMPETGIAKILGKETLHPSSGNGIPRSEIYLCVEKPMEYYLRATEAGAKAISPLQIRDWGDEVAYCADLDGHILAFAKTQ